MMLYVVLALAVLYGLLPATARAAGGGPTLSPGTDPEEFAKLAELLARSAEKKQEAVSLLLKSQKDNMPHYDSDGGYWVYMKYFLPDGTRVPAIEEEVKALVPPAEPVDPFKYGSGVTGLPNMVD